MIFDRLSNYKQYISLNKDLELGFRFLLENDLKNLKDGKYQIDGDRIFANVQSLKTKEKENKKWEAHRKYIDIQYVISGDECMGYGILEDFKDIEIKYNEEKDIEFLNGDKFNYVNVDSGDFVVFYPNDVHAPMLCNNSPKDIKKVIVKIAL